MYIASRRRVNDFSAICGGSAGLRPGSAHRRTRARPRIARRPARRAAGCRRSRSRSGRRRGSGCRPRAPRAITGSTRLAGHAARRGRARPPRRARRHRRPMTIPTLDDPVRAGVEDEGLLADGLRHALAAARPTSIGSASAADAADRRSLGLAEGSPIGLEAERVAAAARCCRSRDGRRAAGGRRRATRRVESRARSLAGHRHRQRAELGPRGGRGGRAPAGRPSRRRREAARGCAETPVATLTPRPCPGTCSPFGP